MYPGTLAKQHPDKTAYRMAAGGERVSYRELDERSNQGAQLFRALGLRPGDAIAIYLENNPRFFEICWAAQRSGLYYTPISYRLTAPEVEYIVRDCGAKVFIASHATRDVAEKLAAGFADLAGLLHGRRSQRRLRELGAGDRAATRDTDRRRDRGLGSALLLGHDRAAEGSEAPRARQADRHAARASALDEGALRRR